ncbi:MAG: dTMP kinase [Neisseriaceae bacterium]|nr:dTMP kinase [Neisseriaceae bacterium]
MLRLISLEGIDGAGKSTHLPFIQQFFAERALAMVLTREPGGTPIGEVLRELVLHNQKPMSLETETLLMFASRQALVDQVLRPTLQSGTWVVVDRFTDSTFAYQGGGRGLALTKIEQLAHWVHADIQPSLTFLFDVPTDTAQARIDASGRKLDRFEQEAAAFHERVRSTYLALAETDTRFVVIDGTRSIADIQTVLKAHLMRLCDELA